MNRNTKQPPAAPGPFAGLDAEFRDIKQRFTALLDDMEADAHRRDQVRAWKSVEELCRIFSLGRDKVNTLIRAGKRAGRVRVALFRASDAKRPTQRIELTSFEDFVEAGGLDALPGGKEVAA